MIYKRCSQRKISCSRCPKQCSVPASPRGVSPLRPGRASQRSPLHRRLPSRPTGGRLALKPSQGNQIECSIQISIDDEAALRSVARVDALRKVHMLLDAAALGAFLRRGKPAICDELGFPLPDCLVGHLPSKFPQTHVTDRKGQLAIALHPLHVEVFQHDYGGTQGRILIAGLPEEALDLFLLHLACHLLWQRGCLRRLYALGSLAVPMLDLGFRFRQGGSDLGRTFGPLCW